MVARRSAAWVPSVASFDRKGSAVGLKPSPRIRVRHLARRAANASSTAASGAEVPGAAEAAPVPVRPAASVVPPVAARKVRRDQAGGGGASWMLRGPGEEEESAVKSRGF